MRTLFLMLALVTSASLFAPAITRAADSDPAADVWLKPIIAPCFSEDDTVSQAAHRTIEAKYITPELRKLLKDDSDEAARRQDVGRLDFDWVINAQAIPVKWSLGKPVTKGDRTEVPVYTSLPVDKEHTYFMILQRRTDGAASTWVIVDARYSDNSTLLSILKAPLP